MKNYYILWAFLGCIIYAVVLFVINAAPSLSPTTAANEFILISTTKNSASNFFTILVLLFIIYNLRPYEPQYYLKANEKDRGSKAHFKGVIKTANFAQK